MHSFKDADGREWKLKLTITTVKQIKEQHGINIADADDFLRLHQDFELFGKVLGTLLGPQIVEAGLPPAALESAMDGDALAAARDAMLEELAFFSPNRDAARKAIPAVKKRQEKLLDDLVKKIETGEMDEKLMSSLPSNGSPAPSASPTPGP